MSYTVNRTNGTTLTEVADNSINTTDSSIYLVGRGAVNYGQAIAESFIRLLENFAHITPPENPMLGQIWYDTGNSMMKFFNGAEWKPLGGATGNSGVTGDLGGGTSIGGSVVSGNRAAGSTGIVISSGTTSTTIAVTYAEGKIIHVTSPEHIQFAQLPAQVLIDQKLYLFASRFQHGLKAGLNLAADPATYVIHGPKGDIEPGKTATP